jgi:hypothetical protein
MGGEAMNSVRFETRNRQQALKFLQRWYPDTEVHDTPDDAGAVLDLVEADVIRIPDPALHPNGAIFPSNNWNADRYAEVVNALDALHRRKTAA